MDTQRPIHVLMVEDSPADVLLAREALAFMPNVRLSSRSRLADVAAVIDGQPVDVALLDLGLPDSQGLDTLTAFRRRLPHVPVVVLTVRKAEEVGLQALHAGAQDFLVKSDVIGMDVGRSVLYALERSRIEGALRASEGRFRLLVENARDHAIFPLDPDGRVAGWNAGAERVTGYPEDEIIGRPLSAFDPPDATSAAATAALPRAADGRAEWEGWWARRGGHRMWVTVTVCKLDGATGQDGYVVVIRDATEKRLLEERLKSAERLEAIGRLAGGVAHDFNNLLTVINGYASLLAADLPASGPSGEAVAAVRDAGERAARLTAQLLAYGRRAMVEPKVIDLNAVLAQSEELLRRLVREDVALSVVADPKLRPVRIDPAQLEQVLLNLVVNARDAMPGGGRLTLQTSVTLLAEGRPTDSGELRPGWYAELAVRDTGVGMSAETKARIFEPFFTTKPPGIGTGLGLATVYGIVRQAGGHVAVQSEVGRGTEFRVLLPAVADAADGATAPPSAVPVETGKETVLLVEDEPLVLNLAKVVLESHGYTVLACASGAAALDAAGAHAGPIHLLVADVVMPGMGGRELAEVLLRSRPGVRVVFMSGYTDDDVLRQGVGGAAVAYVQKPFTPLALAKRVRAILDGRDQPPGTTPATNALRPG